MDDDHSPEVNRKNFFLSFSSTNSSREETYQKKKPTFLTNSKYFLSLRANLFPAEFPSNPVLLDHLQEFRDVLCLFITNQCLLELFEVLLFKGFLQIRYDV